MSIWARFYEHADYGGRSAYARLPYQDTPSTYLKLLKSWLSSTNLHDKISSLEIGASSSERGGLVILFEHERYRGRYAMFSCKPGTTEGTPWIGRTFNDITSSILFVRQFTWELEPIILGNIGSPTTLRNQIGALIAAEDKLSLRGDPIITWDMWPSFAPSTKYVYIRIPVVVAVDNWWDYDAEVRFWIYFYINSSSKIRGYVAWYGAWVEGGWKTESVLDGLMEGIAGKVDLINELISSNLEQLQDKNFIRLYYLPGRASNTGHVNDDVTLVLVKIL